jgi:hypothetical protein
VSIRHAAQYDSVAAVRVDFTCLRVIENKTMRVKSTRVRVVACWARTQDLRLTCPPSYALGYCVELNMKKKYQSY